jgi:hypothetical protein
MALYPAPTPLVYANQPGPLPAKIQTFHPGYPTRTRLHKEAIMVVLGVILALIGLLAGISALLWIGLILLVIGLVLNVSGRAAPYGSRWY